MQTRSAPCETDVASHRSLCPRQSGRCSGFSLVEVVIAMFLLVVMAGGTTAALIQSRKLAASNLAQGFAGVTAQSIVEQLVAQPFLVLTDTSATSVTIKLPSLNEHNRATLEDFNLPWAASDSDFTAVGAPDASAGILIDAAYIKESKTIRPQRYLPVRMCLRREITEAASERRVTLVLRYQWAIPDRKGPGGAPIYLGGEHRTVRSSAVSF